MRRLQLRQVGDELAVADGQGQPELVVQVGFLQHIGDVVFHRGDLHTHGLGDFVVGQTLTR